MPFERPLHTTPEVLRTFHNNGQNRLQQTWKRIPICRLPTESPIRRLRWIQEGKPQQGRQSTIVMLRREKRCYLRWIETTDNTRSNNLLIPKHPGGNRMRRKGIRRSFPNKRHRPKQRPAERNSAKAWPQWNGQMTWNALLITSGTSYAAFCKNRITAA